jgi:hypothetical protein
MSISSEQRQHLRERAGNCCEYCRVPETGRLNRLHVDHIIAVKHGGTDEDDNLCLACYKCNGYKGSNVAALDPATGEATKLYHPRRQKWNDHFQVNSDATLTGLTPEGRATIAVLRINDKSRVRTRRVALMAGDYPCRR